MPHYPKIWFLRHGQTEWNKEFRLQGQLNSPLTAQGVQEAAAQAELIKPILRENPAVFVSPLGRALQTARIVLGAGTYVTDPRLMEIDAGQWQGRLRHEILSQNPAWQAQAPTALELYEAAPDGEGLHGLHSRITAFLADLTGPSVIIAHGLWGQVMRAQIRGLPLETAGDLSNRQGCIYLLENGQETLLEPVE